MMEHMGNVMPDTMQAENMRKNHMRNVDGTEGKEGASQGEGERMAAANRHTDENTRQDGDKSGTAPR